MAAASVRAKIAVSAALGALVVGGLTGCGAAADAEPAPPTALTFAFTKGFADPQVAALQDAFVANGLELDYDPRFSTEDHGVEQSIVRAVARGELDLGLVGARAFSELGVHDLDALVAPFVVDSLQTQQAVLDSDMPERMLASLDLLSVSGLELIGGALRRPVHAGEVLTGVSDYAGVPFHSWHGDVNAATITALGAVNVDLAPPERNGGIDDGSILAYENAVSFLANTADFPVNVMTADVSLWPSIGVLIANPRMLEQLTPDRREALEAAAEDVASRALELLDDEAALAEKACAGGARFGYAGDDARQELRDAVDPVLRALRRHPATTAYLDEIATLRGTTPPDVVAVPPECLTG